MHIYARTRLREIVRGRMGSSRGKKRLSVSDCGIVSVFSRGVFLSILQLLFLLFS